MKFIHALIWVVTAVLLWACVATSFATSFPDQIENLQFRDDRVPTLQIAPPTISTTAYLT